MLTWRWIISHRCCWKTVYVSWCNAQLNLIVFILSYICIVMRSLFVNCPAVICLPSMLVIFYGETPLVNCGPRSILLHWNKHRLHHVPPSFARCPVFAFTFIFHTICLILCFQQAEEIDNLLFRWGKVVWLFCVQVPRQHSCCAARVADNLLSTFDSSWIW